MAPPRLELAAELELVVVRLPVLVLRLLLELVVVARLPVLLDEDELVVLVRVLPERLTLLRTVVCCEGADDVVAVPRLPVLLLVLVVVLLPVPEEGVLADVLVEGFLVALLPLVLLPLVVVVAVVVVLLLPVAELVELGVLADVLVEEFLTALLLFFELLVVVTLLASWISRMSRAFVTVLLLRTGVSALRTVKERSGYCLP